MQAHAAELSTLPLSFVGSDIPTAYLSAKLSVEVLVVVRVVPPDTYTLPHSGQIPVCMVTLWETISLPSRFALDRKSVV